MRLSVRCIYGIWWCSYEIPTAPMHTLRRNYNRQELLQSLFKTAETSKLYISTSETFHHSGWVQISWQTARARRYLKGVNVNCPKCNTKMHTVSECGFGNSLDRDNQGLIHSGWKCRNCGKWIEPDVEPTLKIIPKQKPASDPIQHMICGNIKAIIRWRKLNFSWVKICERLELPISHNTLRKYAQDMKGVVWEDYPQKRKPLLWRSFKRFCL